MPTFALNQTFITENFTLVLLQLSVDTTLDSTCGFQLLTSAIKSAWTLTLPTLERRENGK